LQFLADALKALIVRQDFLVQARVPLGLAKGSTGAARDPPAPRIRTSAIPPLTTKQRTLKSGRFVPIGDIAVVLFNHLVGDGQYLVWNGKT
jgi:hypothetical protein